MRCEARLILFFYKNLVYFVKMVEQMLSCSMGIRLIPGDCPVEDDGVKDAGEERNEDKKNDGIRF